MTAEPSPDVDVLVVGAGSSGAVLAGRLAERGVEVLLLEEGPDWRSEDLSPDLRQPRPDIFAWKVSGTTPAGFLSPGVLVSRWPDGKPEPYVRGRGLGGTSVINGLVVIRPPLEEFDEWVAAGCAGWGADDVLPYFIRSEHDFDYGAAPYHGRSGPTPIVRREDSAWGSMDRLLADSALAAGHDWSPDHNAPGAFGVSRTALNIRMGVRVTTNDSYLEPVRAAPNLRIVGEALVDSVTIRSGTATGVRALVRGEPREFTASRIVLAAGAAATPGVLQRSGVGPAAALRALGVPVLADLPVGVGVQDHLGYWLSVDLGSGRPAQNGARGNVTLRYSSGIEGCGPGDLLMVGANPLPADPDTGAVGVKLAQVSSRGASMIRSPDPREAADISLNLLTDERDRVLARRSLRDALDLLAPSAAADRTVRDRNGRVVPRGMGNAEIDSWLRTVATDTSHLSSGARMGRPDDPDTVVDSDCRVLGVDGLYVGDLSIAPWVPRANTHLAAIMIGERVADLLTD